jgi:hypothetical protein
MKQQLKFYFLLLISAASFQTSAQQQKIIAMSVESNAPADDTTQYGVPVIDSTTLFTAVMTVILDNTDSIYQIHVKLGSTLHGAEFLSTAFDYGASGTFGSTSYSQSGNTIQLGLGTHAGMISYYAEVQIERADHSLEDAILFSNN